MTTLGFWESKSGMVIDGSDENSFSSSFRIIPDGTTAIAKIHRFELVDRFETPFHQVTWRITEGQFKGQQVRQKLATFDDKPEKQDRALNMMMRLYKIAKQSPKHSGTPTNNDLKALENTIAGIKIQEWAMEGQEGNWVSEVHMLNENFIPEIGKKIERKQGVESALTRNPKNAPISFDDDSLEDVNF